MSRSKKNRARSRARKGLHSVSSFWERDKRDVEDIDWDEEIWGDGNGASFDPASHDLDAPPAPTSTVPLSYGKSFGSGWGATSWLTLDPTNPEWNIRKADRHQREAEEDAQEALNVAGKAFKAEFEEVCNLLGETEVQAVVALLGKHTDMVIAKVQKDYTHRERDRVTRGSEITPMATWQEFMDLGARAYEVLKLDQGISQANLDLLAASLDALSYIHPARDWDVVDQETEWAANKVLKALAEGTAE